jgi:hypothetical protein
MHQWEYVNTDMRISTYSHQDVKAGEPSNVANDRIVHPLLTLHRSIPGLRHLNALTESEK